MKTGKVSAPLFIGTKVVHATPMTRLEYNNYRGWALPPDEDGSDAGFLVEYIDGGNSNHPDHKGYISWSPADVFARAYRPAIGLSFGEAIAALKAGERVARAGWNGKGMFVSIQQGSYASNLSFEDTMRQAGGIDLSLFDLDDNGTVTRLPMLVMRTAQGATQAWLASQSDMLAADWEVVD